MNAWVAAVVACLLLAGCSDDGDGPETDDRPRQVDEPLLQGWVFDEAVRPLPGVTVSVLEQPGASVQTDADGHYAFDALPTGQALFVAVSLREYEPQTKGVTLHPQLPTRLNFTLARVPVAQPYHDVIPFEGFLACQLSVVLGEENEVPQDCSGDEQVEETFAFSADAGVAGVVVEVAWTPAQPLASSFHAALFIGQDTEPVAEIVGGSILRLQVAEQIARDRMPNGGDLRVEVRVMPNTDETEAGAGIGLAVNQGFQVFASVFYVQPPDPTYTVAQ